MSFFYYQNIFFFIYYKMRALADDVTWSREREQMTDRVADNVSSRSLLPDIKEFCPKHQELFQKVQGVFVETLACFCVLSMWQSIGLLLLLRFRRSIFFTLLFFSLLYYVWRVYWFTVDYDDFVTRLFHDRFVIVAQSLCICRAIILKSGRNDCVFEVDCSAFYSLKKVK